MSRLSPADWELIEKIIEKAVRAARTEELRELAESLKILAEYVKRIFEILEKHSEILEKHSKILEEHTRILEEHTKILEEHSRSLAEIKATVGGFTRRLGVDLERTILSIYRDMLKAVGVEPVKVEKISFKDVEGRYYRRGARLELDIYVHDKMVYFIEVKSLAEVDDVEWFETRCEIFEKILGRRPDRKILVAVNITEDALERARELGIHAIYGNILKD